MNSRLHDPVELVVDDNFIDISTEAINEHAANDRSFQKYIGKLEKNDKGRALIIKGFLAIKWHLGLLGYSQKSECGVKIYSKNKKKLRKLLIVSLN